MKRLLILGVGGTFMGGVARLACDLGYEVSGVDNKIYPPMSNQLDELGITLYEGYDEQCITESEPDLVLIGNVLSRGNPAIERVLNDGLAYTSGAQWIGDHLRDRWVLAVAGTHGKTTTSSLLAWLLESAGLNPGFLIGGVPENFEVSARLGNSPFFVIEADEYDTAFFDKRSKFVHYRPRTLVLNNLEFDHDDIFATIEDIKRQFHHLVRSTPGQGKIIVNSDDPRLKDVLAMGCWSTQEDFSVAESTTSQLTWSVQTTQDDCSEFEVYHHNSHVGTVNWGLIGKHNVSNALGAIAAAWHAGVPVTMSCKSLSTFKSVKRRLELISDKHEIYVYDDFAHHPTAIRETLAALRARVKDARIFCVLEPASNTMRSGTHSNTLGPSLERSDVTYIVDPQTLNWDIHSLSSPKIKVFESGEDIVDQLEKQLVAGDHVVIMSNSSFDDFNNKLISKLNVR